VPFHEHVLLGGCLSEFPQIEQIQQFMAIILNGLSQNSFLTIDDKRETIQWYKNYFNEKLDIIKEALETERLEASYQHKGSKSQ
jgi:small subunit ribosomal protein S31